MESEALRKRASEHAKKVLDTLSLQDDIKNRSGLEEALLQIMKAERNEVLLKVERVVVKLIN